MEVVASTSAQQDAPRKGRRRDLVLELPGATFGTIIE